MSFDVILLNEKGEPVIVENHSEGGTYVMGGTRDAELNVTYNYSHFYYQHLNGKEGLRWLNGKKAKDVIDALEKAIRELGIERDSDYWEATEGNAGYALRILLTWARQYPDAVFEVY
ncbi:MAG: hypothetical protein PHP08_00875 [Candidatus Dojkabacteria bacterium]|nr:hypothetical protein [Candidatus Dojkabacteria bacterium]